MVGVVSVYLVCGWYGIGMGSVKSVWLVCSQYVIVHGQFPSCLNQLFICCISGKCWSSGECKVFTVLLAFFLFLLLHSCLIGLILVTVSRGLRDSG